MMSEKRMTKKSGLSNGQIKSILGTDKEKYNPHKSILSISTTNKVARPDLNDSEVSDPDEEE
jgi:hypothetical protein